jgi:hypothetical protein
MPWCEDCAKYWAPSAMNADGTCPTCGRSLERTQAEPITAKNIDLKKLAAGEDGDEDSAKAPWHFKLLLVLLVLYLAWRVIDLIR